MTHNQESTTQLHIRPFQHSDSRALADLNAYGLRAAGISPEDDYYADADMADLEASYAPANGGTMLVGVADGRVVAMGGIRRVDASTCELLRMRVCPEYQGRGFGSAMLTSLEDEARKLGYQRITLLTGEFQHPAVDVYRRHGYRVDRRESLLGIASVHMSKPLPRR